MGTVVWERWMLGTDLDFCPKPRDLRNALVWGEECRKLRGQALDLCSAFGFGFAFGFYLSL